MTGSKFDKYSVRRKIVFCCKPGNSRDLEASPESLGSKQNQFFKLKLNQRRRFNFRPHFSSFSQTRFEPDLTGNSSTRSRWSPVRRTRRTTTQEATTLSVSCCIGWLLWGVRGCVLGEGSCCMCVCYDPLKPVVQLRSDI